METIKWLWDLLPWQVMVAVLVIGGGAAMYFAAPFIALLPKPVKWAFGAIAAIVVAVQYGRNQGRKDSDAKRAADNAKAVEKRKEIDDDVSHLSDSSVDAELRKSGWLRDK